MKYTDFMEFCRFVLHTEADETSLANYHIKPNGYIMAVLMKVMDAIIEEKDFDFRAYFAYLVNCDLDGFPLPDKKDDLLN